MVSLCLNQDEFPISTLYISRTNLFVHTVEYTV